MDYTRLVIHPLGTPDECNKVISEVVTKFGGVFKEKNLLGMIMYEGEFADNEIANKCMTELQELKEVSHVEWIETT
jgi:hypothetical protein